MPSALAALRLTTNSNLVDRSIGKSAGFVMLEGEHARQAVLDRKLCELFAALGEGGTGQHQH